MSLPTLKNLVADADLFGFIKLGADRSVYDKEAEYIFSYLSMGLSIEQIQNVIWHALYQNCCICTNTLTNEPWTLDIDQAVFIIGDPIRFKDLAYGIRHAVLSL